MMNETRDFWSEIKFAWFVIFCWLALVGVILLLVNFFISHEGINMTLTIAGLLLLVPFALHANLLVIWHWKGRYRGSHSKLWGALILLETFGWFRVAYLIMHVVPDRRNKGRYFRTVVPETYAPAAKG